MTDVSTEVLDEDVESRAELAELAESFSLARVGGATRKFLAAWRPPARVWLELAAAFQPGLSDARSEATAKAALAAGVDEMGGHHGKLGCAWGDVKKPLKKWHGIQLDKKSSMGGRYGNGVWGVNEMGLPTRLYIFMVYLRGPLSEQLCRLTSLTHLYLCNGAALVLPCAIRRLSNLTHLGLNHSELTSLPDDIGHLTRLVRLELHHNRLTTLPDGIGRLKRLTRLELGYNRFRFLPDVIGRLTSLTHLDVSQNYGLTELSEAIGHLMDLKKLNLAHNRLRFLPDAVGRLTQLQRLDLSGNMFTEAPAALRRWTHLTHLDLCCNELTEAPEYLDRLSDLVYLKLSCNNFDDKEKHRIRAICNRCFPTAILTL